MPKTVRFIIVSICAVSFCGWGQSILSLSYPFGLPLRSLSSTALSMGGVSVGVPNDHHVMLTNPGNLGTIDITAFSSLWFIDYIRINDNGAYSDHIRTAPRQLSFALPLGLAGTIAFSLAKTTDATIKYRQEELLYSKKNPLSSTFTSISYDREGGTTSWQAGWGRSIGKYVNIGFAYQRYYFSAFTTKLTDVTFQTKAISIAKIDTTQIDPNTISIVTTYDTTEYEEEITERDSTHLSFGGNGLRFGIMGTIKKFTAGLAVNYYFQDNLKYFSSIYNNSSSLPVDSALLSSFTDSLQLPHSIATGLSYEISPKWLVGADLTFDLWQYYYVKGRQILAVVETDNTVSFSAGFRFIPAPNLLAPRYWETIHLRGGIRYSQLPGKTSSEFSGALGFGFPLKGNGLLDLGFELGRRTHEDYSDYNETFLQVSIGLNGGRKWIKTPTSTY